MPIIFLIDILDANELGLGFGLRLGSLRLPIESHRSLMRGRRQHQVHATNVAPGIFFFDQSHQVLSTFDGQLLAAQGAFLATLEIFVDRDLIEEKSSTVERIFTLTDHVIVDYDTFIDTTMIGADSQKVETTTTIHR